MFILKRLRKSHDSDTDIDTDSGFFPRRYVRFVEPKKDSCRSVRSVENRKRFAQIREIRGS